ncbi:MAG: hypothetical protein Q9181_003469 [Wetmoreana brouardii]
MPETRGLRRGSANDNSRLLVGHVPGPGSQGRWTTTSKALRKRVSRSWFKLSCTSPGLTRSARCVNSDQAARHREDYYGSQASIWGKQHCLIEDPLYLAGVDDNDDDDDGMDDDGMDDDSMDDDSMDDDSMDDDGMDADGMHADGTRDDYIADDNVAEDDMDDDGMHADDIDYEEKHEDEKCTHSKPEMRCPCAWPDTLCRDPQVREWLSLTQGEESYSVKFTFQKLSPEDPDVAIFECWYRGIPGRHTAVPMKIIAALASQDLAVSPFHMVKLHGNSIQNDTALPGFSVNVDQVTISFRWKDMFTRLLGEELVRGNILRKKILDNPALPRSFLDLPPALHNPYAPNLIAQAYTSSDPVDYLHKFNHLFIDSTRLARQARLRRALQQLEGREIDTTSALFQRQEVRAFEILYNCFLVLVQYA